MCYFTAFYFAVIPNIENLINDVIINQQENATFSCKSVGEPIPDIFWNLNGIMINISDSSWKYMIMSRSLNITTIENTLTVYNVTSSDVGTYTCNSSNIIGSITSFGILTVTSKILCYLIISQAICDCLSENWPSLHNYKYLEIPI